MFTQTIALLRYQLFGILNLKVLVMLGGIFATGFLLSRFIAELAIINSESISLAMLADFLRYSLVIMMMIIICHQISQDYELAQFDRFLAMPMMRGQYVLAEFLLVILIAVIFIVPVFLLMFWLGSLAIASYWSLALLMELLLMGQLAVLATISLEKLPVALIFSMALYLLSKSVPFIDLIFNQSTNFYQEEISFQLGHYIFTVIEYVLPDLSAFAQNNAIFDHTGWPDILARQFISILIYGVFIQCIVLIDFYRKEFNQS